MSNGNTIWPLISHLQFTSELESSGCIHCSCMWAPCGLICCSHKRYEGLVTAELLMSAGVCPTLTPSIHHQEIRIFLPPLPQSIWGVSGVSSKSCWFVSVPAKLQQLCCRITSWAASHLVSLLAIQLLAWPRECCGCLSQHRVVFFFFPFSFLMLL